MWQASLQGSVLPFTRGFCSCSPKASPATGVAASTGMGVWPHAILDVRDAKGTVLYERTGSGPGRAVPAQDARTLTRMMTKVIDGGTGKAAAIGRPAAGKTGTSQNYRDAWFIGFTPQLVTGVWFGNDDGAPMRRVTGGGLPARTWGEFMTGALQGMPVLSFDDVGDDGVPGSRSFWSRLKDLVGTGANSITTGGTGTSAPVGENRAGD